ncbi:pilus assembly protein PilM [Thalassomonas sp. M1454]|uniref:pilus assembly protein PilM n=1 Tax=Thalassomonas sp. M1454 TaxID=2594477 RepID=UPI001180D34B|nr:pilus assembly protein PilM [Thalassomonas sp. M1454]TRX57861.1 pilus assembly protein PilM [Thalassomonas sp. M1454]
MLNKLWNKKASLMVGIDIGSHSVKAVLINEDKNGYQLQAFSVEPMPKGAVVDRKVQDIEAVGAVVRKIRKKVISSVQNAAVAVSGSTVITKIIYMDVSLNEDELASQIEIEADSLIPYPLDEVSLDFEKLEVNESDPSKVNVLLSAVRTETIEARVAGLDAGGFKTKVVDVESYALNRAADLCMPMLPDDAADKVVAFIDIGATMTLFTVNEDGNNIYTRDQLFGSEQYTRSIVSYYNKSYEEAEKEKITNALPPTYTFEVLAPFQTTLIQQIRRAIQMYLTFSGKEKLDYLVVSGGTAALESIQELLSAELGIHTIIANPFNSMELGEQVDEEALIKVAPQLMVASGLALRSFSPCHI